jgi:hypothetical protein
MKYNTEIREEYHPIANAEPMMQESELDSLVRSMQKIGYDSRQPITIFVGLILDGRNRYIASEFIGIEPTTVEFKGTYQEAVEESNRLNNARRHKSPSQKAMTAAYAIHTSNVNEGGDKSPLSIRSASKMYGVDKKYVSNALKVLHDDVELANDVFDGIISLTKALKTLSEIEDLKCKARRSNDGKYTPEEIKRFELLNTIKNHPELIADSMENLERKLAESKHSEKLQAKVFRSELDDIKENITKHHKLVETILGVAI